MVLVERKQTCSKTHVYQLQRAFFDFPTGKCERIWAYQANIIQNFYLSVGIMHHACYDSNRLIVHSIYCPGAVNICGCALCGIRQTITGEIRVRGWDDKDWEDSCNRIDRICVKKHCILFTTKESRIINVKKELILKRLFAKIGSIPLSI